ncbi:putative reverse transcriptase domain-containing protein [Tanacetum coccineum]
MEMMRTPSGEDTINEDADDMMMMEPFRGRGEHLAPLDSLVTLKPFVDHTPSPYGTEYCLDLSQPMSSSMEALIADILPAPNHPLKWLPIAPSPIPFYPSPLTLQDSTDACAPLGYRAASCLPTPKPSLRYEIGESSAAGAARQPGHYPEVDTWDEIVEAIMEIAPTTFEGVNQRVTELDTTFRQRTESFEIETTPTRRTALAMDREAVYARIAWTSSEERSAAIEAHVRTLEAQVATLITQDYITLDSVDYSSWTVLRHAKGKETHIPRCTKSEAEAAAKMSYNEEDPHTTPATDKSANTINHHCTTAQTPSFEIDQRLLLGFAERTEDRWPYPMGIKEMESIFSLSDNCAITSQVQFASCTLQGSALTWWNSHVRAVGQDVAYTMPWTALKRMITDKYCPRGEIKKLESEYWNLKVRGTDLMTYNQRFQELALISKPQSMQEAIEFATEMMDKKMLTAAERQAENKRKFEDTSRNNQNQQQPFKRNNVARAYTAGPGDKKP